MGKTAVVTGGSSGIGRAAALLLRVKGYEVYEFSRRDSQSEDIIHIRCDVTDEASVKSAVDEVNKRSGGIDILILCAGMGISGAAEFAQPDDIRRQMDVNLFGSDSVIRAALPSLRERRGRIVMTSSVAAVAPIPFQTWYSVSKAAINCYSMALSNELRPFGIRVSAVMPGDISTGFTDARKKSEEGDALYQGRINRSVSRMERDERGGMTPQRAAEKIVRVALKKNPKPFYSIGLSYSLICVLLKILPARLSRYLLYQLYAR